MKSYQNTMGEVRQNTSGHSIIYNGTEVKEFDLYGTFDGVVFVSRPFIAMKTGFMPMYVKTSMGWTSIHPCKIVDFLKEAYHARSVSLYDWNAYQQSKKEKRLAMEKVKQKQSETAFLKLMQKDLCAIIRARNGWMTVIMKSVNRSRRNVLSVSYLVLMNMLLFPAGFMAEQSR